MFASELNLSINNSIIQQPEYEWLSYS